MDSALIQVSQKKCCGHQRNLYSVCLNSKLFSDRKLHKIKPLKRFPEVIKRPGLWLPCLLRRFTWMAAETMRTSTHSVYPWLRWCLWKHDINSFLSIFTIIIKICPLPDVTLNSPLQVKWNWIIFARVEL